MPIPKTREELLTSLDAAHSKLLEELQALPFSAENVVCVDEWTIRDLLAVRLWWSRAVLRWIKAGRQGKNPAVPAAGFKWNQTPELNKQVVSESKLPMTSLISELKKVYASILKVLGELDDRELLDVGVFEWAGSHSISRWVSLNMTRQYTTARTLIRRAIKRQKAEHSP